MTFVKLTYTPDDVGFSHPLSEELVIRATEYIRDQLDGVISSHDDTQTRWVDQRRTHESLKSSSWTIRYKGNHILITNEIADDNSRQFEALTQGNGTGPICARHETRRLIKGWSNEDRHKSVMRGGNKPIPGTYSQPYPGFLKFYDKHSGMWQYRHCVRPIDAAIISDMNRTLRRAIFVGLEMARYEMYDHGDKDTGGANEVEDAGMSGDNRPEETVQDVAFRYYSKTKQERDAEEYKQRKLEEEQVTMDSQVEERVVQERARGILQTAGVEPPFNESTAKKESKSWFSKKADQIKKTALGISENAADKIHRFMGVFK